MFVIVGSLAVVIAGFLGVSFWKRANAANETGWQWGIGAALVYLASVLIPALIVKLIFWALSWPGFLAIWIAIVIWFVVTMMAGPKTDSIFASKLSGGGSA